VDQAVEDLIVAFGPPIDEEAIRAIGQRAFDEIKTRGGQRGMQQVFYKFEARMPQHRSELNRFWNRVGSWVV
jgi:hypothetical protein